MLKYFEIKKAFRYYIKQIDSMLPCVWFSNRSQKTSKCGKDISDTLSYASCATFLFLPHFDVICDLWLNRRTATWNLFVEWMELRSWSSTQEVRVVLDYRLVGFLRLFRARLQEIALSLSPSCAWRKFQRKHRGKESDRANSWEREARKRRWNFWRLKEYELA